MSDKASAHTDEQYYGYFLSALMGLEDDATLSGYSEEGIDYLRLAIDAFEEESRQRFPNLSSGN